MSRIKHIALRFTLIHTAAALIAVSTLTAQAQQAELRRFEEQFGRLYYDAQRSPGLTDNINVAKQMLDTALQLKAEDRLATMLLERAGESASVFAPGYTIAFDAYTELARRQPARREQWLGYAASMAQKLYEQAKPTERIERGNILIDILLELAAGHTARLEHGPASLMYAGAEDVASQIASDRTQSITRLRHDANILDQAATLKARLERSPSDRKAADDLMRLLIVEIDDPAAAAEYRFSADDRQLKDHVTLVARSDAQLLNDDLYSLGEWYASLETTASTYARPKLEQRAARYYTAYLQRNTGDATKMNRAKSQLQRLGVSAPVVSVNASPITNTRTPAATNARTPRITTPLPSSSPTTAATPSSSIQGIDLLSPINTSTHSRRGEWTATAEGLRGQRPTPAQIVIPLAPTGDYEIETRFTRESVIGAIVLHLPVNGRPVLLRIADRRRRQRDYIAGLSMLDGQSAEENTTTLPIELNTGEEYRLVVTVNGSNPNNASIAATLNGEPLIAWQGNAASLSIADAWSRLEPTALGLGVDAGGTVIFHEAKLRILNGDAKPIE